ncbi:MAG: murein biosynthesis integral membrane protein MurJ [Gammaproteobacteria bacterium]
MTESRVEKTSAAPHTKKLTKRTSLVSSMTGISRIFGFVRDMVIAHLFGASVEVDAFLVAFKIPNFMRRLFAEGAFSQAFVPVLSEYRKTSSEQEAKQFIDCIAGTLASVLFIVTALGMLLAPVVVLVFAPGFHFHGERFDLASHMLRITFPYLFFISLTAFCSAVLNAYDRFGIPAFTPVLLNIILIAFAVWGAPHFSQPIEALAVGVFVAGVVQLCFQFPFLKRIGLLPWPKVNWHHPGVRRVLTLMVPALFGVSVAQVNLMVDQWFASFLQVGSISWLYYSDRLTSLPQGIFGVAIATVILPSLSRHHAGNESQNYSSTLDWGMRLIFLLGLPAMLGLMLLSGPMLTTLFQYGAFTARDVMMTQESLLAFAFGIVGVMLVKVLASGFYAKQNIKLPVKIAVVAMVSNTIISLCLIGFLFHAGLALATSISGILNAGLLYFYLRKKSYFEPQPGWVKYFIQLACALIAMGMFIFFAEGSMHSWLIASASWRILHLAFIIGLAAGIYFGVLKLLRCRVQPANMNNEG